MARLDPAGAGRDASPVTGAPAGPTGRGPDARDEPRPVPGRAVGRPSSARPAVRLGCPTPLSGRYAAQGAQIREALALYARFEGLALQLEDDRSDPARAAELHALLHETCDVVLGPYGSDSTRAVASAARGQPVWNHGASADDVQRLAGVVSVAAPASGYLAAVARVVATRRAGARISVGLASGRFARLAADGLLPEARRLGLRLAATRPLDAGADALLQDEPDAVLLCGPLDREASVLAAVAAVAPDVVLGGVSPGVDGFAAAAGADVDGVLAPVQWHPDAAPTRPGIGPCLDALAATPGTRERLDYVGVQAIAAAVLARHCLAADARDPLGVAAELDTTTLLGRFCRDRATGLQIGHQLSVVERRDGRRVLVAPP